MWKLSCARLSYLKLGCGGDRQASVQNNCLNNIRMVAVPQIVPSVPCLKSNLKYNQKK